MLKLICVVILASTILIPFQKAEALTCFHCPEGVKNTGRCTTTTTCTAFCRKITYTHDSDDDKITKFGCGDGPSKCMTTSLGELNEEACDCNTDKCNSGEHLRALTAIQLVGITLAVVSFGISRQ